MGFKNTRQNKPGKRAVQKQLKKKRTKADRTEAYVKGLRKKAAKVVAQRVPGASVGKADNRKVPTGKELKGSAATVEKLKASAAADKKKHGQLEQAATPKKPAALTQDEVKKQAALEKKAQKEKELAAMKKSVGKLGELAKNTAQHLGMIATDYYGTQKEISERAPALKKLKAQLQSDEGTVFAACKEANSKGVDKDDLVKRMGSVGRDYFRRKEEVAEAEKSIKNLKARVKTDVEEAFKVIKDKLLGGLLFDQKPDAPAEPIPGTLKEPDQVPGQVTAGVVKGETYNAVVSDGPNKGKSAVVKVLTVKGDMANVEIITSSDDSRKAGDKVKLDVRTMTWTKAESVKELGAKAAAGRPDFGPGVPAATKVPAPGPAWHRRTVESELGESVQPAVVHALKMRGLNTMGDVVAFSQGERDNDDTALTSITGITPGSANEIAKAVNRLEEEAKAAAEQLSADKPAKAQAPAAAAAH